MKPWTRRFTRLCAAVAGLGAASSCQGPDFLYYQANQPPQQINVTHKVKEIQGDSAVDLLWVIDNSGSMGEHQMNLALNANLFISQFTVANILQWRMGLISTDASNRPFLGMGGAPQLDWTSSNPVTTFTAAVNMLGTNGSGLEKMFDPVTSALTSYPAFLRSNAILAMIIITDAPEQGNAPPSQFLTFLTTKKNSLDRVITYGVLGPEDFGCRATDDDWNYAGSRYEQLIKATRGKTYPLCSPDFGNNLAALGKDLVNRVSNPRIYLTQRPKQGSIRVSHLGRELPAGPKEQGGIWSYDFELNAVIFYDLAFAPGEEEKVAISYDIDDGL